MTRDRRIALFLVGAVFVWSLSSFTAAAAAMATTPQQRKILVTGANKGIGKAICERLLSEWDDTHVLLGSRDVGRGQQAVKDITKALGGAVVKGRLECVQLDTSSDESVEKLAAELSGSQLYGIVNNAGLGFGYTFQETLNTNYFGPRRVNDAFAPLLKRPGGRIVNVASASGPFFVRDLPNSALKEHLAKPWTINGGVDTLDALAQTISTSDAYGASKALLNAYTLLYARDNDPDGIIINSCTPGYIATDITAGMGATDPPSKGAIPPCYLLMDEVFETRPTGRYYGSDCQRSPLDRYRSPGDAPFESDEDLMQ